MNVLLTSSGTAVRRLLSLAAIVVIPLVGGQAAAAPGPLTPEGTRAYAEWAVRNVVGYWEPQLAAAGHPTWHLRYWISNGDESTASPCGVMGDPDARPDAESAAYCPPDNAVYVSSSWLYNHTTNNGTTPYGIAEVIAHEVGHAVQAELRLLPPGSRVEPVELQADCFAGAWVGRQARNGQASAKDVHDAQIQVQSSGDYEYGDPQHHGTADQRVGTWTTGLKGGSGSCVR